MVQQHGCIMIMHFANGGSIKNISWGVLYWEFYAKAMTAGFSSNQRLLKGNTNNESIPFMMATNSRFATGMPIKVNVNSQTADSDTFVPHVKGATLYQSVLNNNQMQVQVPLQITMQT